MERRTVIIRGIVQGVGFRPFVFGLASRLGLGGFVRNQTAGVLIEVEGDSASLNQFLAELAQHPPPLARIDHLSWERQAPRGERHFTIQQSAADASGQIFISPDVATCADCLAELHNPADRRHAYPFLNCTNCGPRLTIVTGAPYDRERTTMAAFPMCSACRAEYDNPADRRFHAQPTACPVCGPQLELRGGQGKPITTENPVAYLATSLLQGKIAAVKGLGGYHLACDARNETAVAELRRRKHRYEKPFALMVGAVEEAAKIAEVSAEERELLQSWRRPIVLLQKRIGAGIAASIAPGNPYLGVMLPYTPLHYLLLQAVEGVPLVMTSGNRSDEPIAYEDSEALSRLAGIADLYLLHNRPIHVRCDDSVTWIVGGLELPLRRSRGYAPQPVALPVECRVPTLAVGGQFKGTFALGQGHHAFLSHHLGDLDHFAAYQAFEKDIALYEKLFACVPKLIVYDLHPDYASTRYAQALVNREPVTLLAVQHHHAHLASCLADNGLDEPVIGVTFDGTGYGADGAIWGGEFLVGDYRHFRRLAHLRYVGMPGGDRAIREPWRMAVAHLWDAQVDFPPLKERHLHTNCRTLETMLERKFQTPLTSSAGRLFDAVAALINIRDFVSYEGQAAIELEWLAISTKAEGIYPFEIIEANEKDAPLIIDTRPLIRAVAEEALRGTEPGQMARRFHTTLVEMIVTVCGRLRQHTGLEAVVLSGGVFMNALLTTEVSDRLGDGGFRVFRQRQVPPNDGGLSLGQLAIAAASIKSEF